MKEGNGPFKNYYDSAFGVFEIVARKNGHKSRRGLDAYIEKSYFSGQFPGHTLYVTRRLKKIFGGNLIEKTRA